MFFLANYKINLRVKLMIDPVFEGFYIFLYNLIILFS